MAQRKTLSVHGSIDKQPLRQSDNLVQTTLDEADQRGMPMYLSSCCAVIDGNSWIAPFRRMLRRTMRAEYKAEVEIIPNSSDASATIWQLHVTECTAVFYRIEDSTIAR